MKTLEIQLEIPDEVTDEATSRAKRSAMEAAVIALWQAGGLSMRQAAQMLDVGYYDFLDLLAERGVPVVSEGPDEDEIAKGVQRWKSERDSK